MSGECERCGECAVDCMCGVVSPGHYVGEGALEAIDVIEAFGLNFCLGNAIKYILRCGKKDDAIQDLKKALYYIRRELYRLERNNIGAVDF